MNGIRVRWLFLILSGFSSLAGQDGSIVFSGDFKDVPFTQFAREITQQTGASFYFRESWVQGITVTVSGSGILLEELLDRVLLSRGLNYFIDRWDHVFLTGQTRLVSRLPEYSGTEATGDGKEVSTGAAGVTSAEQKYVNGRKERVPGTLRVGQEEGSSGSDQAVIHGKMTDGETGEALVGATIYIEELKKGTATDLDGRFSLVIKPGKYTVEFNCMGMEGRQNYLEVLSGGDLSVALDKSLIPIAEVMIQANRYSNVRGTQMGVEQLNYKVFKEVPLVMGERDVLKIVQMLPGVQSVGEGASGYNVRGSAADQNMVYVNKVPVYNSSHLFGFFTSFSPDIVRDFTLYKSHLPASMGGRMASFFDISTRQGKMNKYTARGGISPITGHLAVEGPIQKEKSSFILSARSTYSDWILKRMEDPELRNSEAGFYDLAGAFTYEPGMNTLVKAFGYLSHDHFKLASSNEYSYSNSGASVNVWHRFNPRITGDLALVYGLYNFSYVDMTLPLESHSQEYQIGHYELKADLSWLSLGHHSLTYGGNVIYYNLDRGTVEPYGALSSWAPLELGIENGVESGLYLADEMALTSRLTIYAGLRFSTFSSLGPDRVRVYAEGQPRNDDNVIDTLNFERGSIARFYDGLEPRASITYLVGDHSSLKVSYNRVHQFLFMLSNTIAISPTDQWKLCDYHIAPPYVDQLSMGYYQDFPAKSLSASLEIYHKWMHNVVDFKDGASFISGPDVETEIVQGRQKAYGAEVMFRKNSGKLNGWLAYSYSRSMILFDSPIPGERINGGNPYPSNFDRPHNLSLVANLKMSRRLSFSTNLVYVTGRPVTYPVSVYYLNDFQYIHYSSRNSYRIPDYFRIDFSLNMEGTLRERKFSHSYWMLNIYNATGRSNAYSVYFQSDEGKIDGYKLSIFGRPVITLSWNFKLGNYASE